MNFSLRDGLDKVTMTVRTKEFTKHPYPKDVALRYGDKTQRIKFSDRFAITVLWERYPWQSWKYQGELRHTYGIQYFMRLDGMRQMRVMFNAMRMYNVLNKLPLYKGRLWDDNVVEPAISFGMAEFVEMLQKLMPQMIDDYIQLRFEMFGDILTREDITVDTHQVEVVCEGIGLHTYDVIDTFKEHARCQRVTVFHDASQTTYLNTSYRRQLKIYQKGLHVLRLESVFNVNAGDVVFNWKGDPDMIVESIQKEWNRTLDEMNIPIDWWKRRNVSRDSFVWMLADAYGLREEGRKDGRVEVELMKTLLGLSYWPSTKDNKDLTAKLRRKGLIVGYERGKYKPTKKLQAVQILMRRLDGERFWTEREYVEKGGIR